MKKIAVSLILLFCLRALPVSAEGEWLSEIPKSSRPKTSAVFASLRKMQDRLLEDYVGAMDAEARYARKARSLARALDIAASGGASASAEQASALSDQRRLRWENARDLAEKRFGRAGPRGFESALVVEPLLKRDGQLLSAALQPRLARLSRKAFAALVSDLEDRTARGCECPPAAFAALRAAAASLPPPDRRLWALSLCSGLAEGPLDAFAGRLADPASGGALPDAFAAALSSYEAVLSGAASAKPLLAAAAAAAWLVDSDGAPVLPAAAASALAASHSLAAAEPDRLGAALIEFPPLDRAFGEYASWLWVAYGTDAGKLLAVCGIEPETAKAALEKAWAARKPMPASSGDSAPTIAAVRSAERMAAFIESDPAQNDLLTAFATLRTDPSALRAFASGGRYADARGRVSAAYAPIAEAAAEAASGDGSLVFSAVPDAFGPMPIAARENGTSVAPERFATVYALVAAGSLGRRNQDKDAADNVSWLESRGFLFTVPFLAETGEPDPFELEALGAGSVFFPPETKDPLSAERRDANLRGRLRSAAAASGVPLRFVDSSGDVGERLAALYSCAARLASGAGGRAR